MQKRRISRPRHDKAPSCSPEPPWIIEQGRSLYCYHHSVLLVFNHFLIKYLTIAKLAVMASNALGKTLRMIGPIFHAVHIYKGLCISLEKILKRPLGADKSLKAKHHKWILKYYLYYSIFVIFYKVKIFII